MTTKQTMTDREIHLEICKIRTKIYKIMFKLDLIAEEMQRRRKVI